MKAGCHKTKEIRTIVDIDSTLKGSEMAGISRTKTAAKLVNNVHLWYVSDVKQLVKFNPGTTSKQTRQSRRRFASKKPRD